MIQRVVSGDWKPGELLPSEMKLAVEYHVSQGTVRKALDELTAENVVVRRQGRGTFVAEHDDHRALFHSGQYVPLEGRGPQREHLFAFARIHDETSMVAIVPRLLTTVIADVQTAQPAAEVWRDTWLVMPAWREGTKFRNIFTGQVLSTTTSEDRQVLPVEEMLTHAPVAWLEKVG